MNLKDNSYLNINMASKPKQKYIKMDPLEHILHRSDTYVGSTRERETEEYISYFNENFHISKKTILFCPAILRIFVEPLSNAIDNVTRSKKSNTPCTKIKVNINIETGETSIWNDGACISIEINEDEGCYNHSLIFGQLLTSSNYDDEEDRYNISGRNGLGSKLTNVFSESFKVKGLDPVNKKIFEQEWSQNMKIVSKPKITSTTLKKGYTEISWIPDFKQFDMKSYTQDVINLYCKYVVDAAMLTNVDVYFNDVLIPVKSLKDYSKLYSSINELDILTINTTDAHIVLMPSSHFESISFVNGVYTSLGGTHVDAWIEATLRPIVQKLTSPSGISFTIGDVKKFFKIFVVVMVINPEFESQSKHKLESPVKASVSKKDITTILGWSVIDDIKRSKELGALKKLERKKKNFVKIEGLDPANNEGSKLGHQCTLILVEGLAAKTYAVKGIDVGAFGKKGRDWFGIYALRGKVLNVRNAKTASIAKNNVIADIIKALGAQIGFNYKETEKFMSLRYGKILIITDADVDGIHISGLLQNMVHTLFPSLLERDESFVTSMQTPIVRVFLPKTESVKEILFYDETAFSNYVSDYNTKNPGKKINTKYYKGLGSSSDQDIMDTFGQKMINFKQDEHTSFNMNKVFHTKQSDARKTWLENYDSSKNALQWKGDKHEIVSLNISDFLNSEMIKFSINDCKRSLPSLMDGLKESHRKTLYACFLRNLKYTGKSLKVAQLAGYVSEHTAYHHGEQNLYDTITRMANSYPGSNNIPLLYRDGQFGCVDPNTPILMWDFSIKKACDIKVGDKLVGDDGTERNVTAITSGEDEMYEISRDKMDSYVVNSHHILTLKFSNHKTIVWKESSKKWTMNYIDIVNKTAHSKYILINSEITKEKAFEEMKLFASTVDDCNIIDINVQEYLSLPKHIRNNMKGLVNSSSIQKEYKQLSIDPYILGCWLGNGIQDGNLFSSVDEEIIKSFVIWLHSIGCKVVHNEKNGCKYYIRKLGVNYKLSLCNWMCSKRTNINPFKQLLKKNNLYKNKHIPHDYIINSENVRLQLIAGLIDTNGTLKKQNDNNIFDIYQLEKYQSVINSANIIAISLGFKTSISKLGGMLCLSIEGDLTRIPTRVQSKKVDLKSYKIDTYCHSIQIKHIGRGNFNGWNIDKNERFLLGDSTITHNTRLSGGKDAANARYIFTKLDALTRLLFRPEDDVLLERVVDDGDTVEPVFYVPILPTILINGCVVGIGTGWSCSVPCYNPLDLIESVKYWLNCDGNVLSKEDGTTVSLLPAIDPWYRGYTGKIESSGDSKYTSWGNIIEEKKTKVVNELPIGMWTDNFKEYLDDLLEEKVIHKVKNYSTPKYVRFVITESDDGLLCDVKNLKLYKYIYTSNMVLFDSKGKITKYNNVDEIINEFCQVRLVYYTKRKNYMIQKLDHDIKFLGNKKRFLEEIMTGDIKLFDDKGKIRKSRKTLDIFKDLEKRGYDKEVKESKNKDDEEDNENDDKNNGYDYLLRLQFRSITEEKINSLKNDIDSKIKIRDSLSNTSEKQMWIQDLDEFEKAYVKWVKDVEKEIVKTNKK